ncbi:MAG: cyclic nucleotide-binding domain-containing protein [Actinomycetota bacterium]|nr:cyclic nucleotide-binding domain-containing protein [Actinomycetota bacterium]
MVTELVESSSAVENGRPPQSLSTAAARNLATTTKSVPQMQSISPRWLLRMLPWVEVEAGTYRVNRRLTYTVGDGRVTCTNTGAEVRVIPEELRELPVLRGFNEPSVLNALADRFEQREFSIGDLIVEAEQPVDQVVLIAHGKANKIGPGKYGDPCVLDVLADGEHVGTHALLEPQGTWAFSVRAVTACTVLVLPRQAFEEVVDQSEPLRAHIQQLRARPHRPQTKHGEAAIELASGHHGEPDLPATFVDYELAPREYQMSMAQTVLRVHSRVADLYNDPMDQVEQQLRLTIEALRERQEHELINNRDFGLLHNADLRQCIHTRTGPPTPDDLDELLARRRKPKFFLAHPRTIAAFGRECSRRGVYPTTTSVDGSTLITWRGVPIFPSNKIPITAAQTSSILVLRIGEEDQGVIGLRQTRVPDEYQPGLSVRFMNINEKAVVSYLVSTYFSTAILVPDALGVLEDVEIGR